jgi:tRNA G18 (ribose-2'-O)-methylase SpoU
MTHQNDSVVKFAVSELSSIESFLIRTKSVSIFTVLKGLEQTPSVVQSKMGNDRTASLLARLVTGLDQFNEFAIHALANAKPYFPVTYCYLDALVRSAPAVSDLYAKNFLSNINQYLKMRIGAFPVILRPALVSMLQQLVLGALSNLITETAENDPAVLESLLGVISRLNAKTESLSHLKPMTIKWMETVVLNESCESFIDLRSVQGAAQVLRRSSLPDDVEESIRSLFRQARDRTYMSSLWKVRLGQICVAFPIPGLVNGFVDDIEWTEILMSCKLTIGHSNRLIHDLKNLISDSHLRSADEIFNLVRCLVLIVNGDVEISDELVSRILTLQTPRVSPDFTAPVLDVGMESGGLRTREDIQDIFFVMKWRVLTNRIVQISTVSSDALIDELRMSGSTGLVELNRFILKLLTERKIENRSEFLHRYIAEIVIGILSDRDSDSNNVDCVQSTLDIAFVPESGILDDQISLMKKVLKIPTPNIARYALHLFLAVVKQDTLHDRVVDVLAELIMHKEPFDEAGIEGSVFGSLEPGDSEIETTSAYLRVLTLVYVRELGDVKLIHRLVERFLGTIKQYQEVIVSRKAPQTPLPFTPFHQVQLRVFQALCYLAPLVDRATFSELIEPDLFGPLLQWANQPDARDYLETLSVYFLTRFDWSLDRLVSTLCDFSLSSQAVASFVVIGGFIASQPLTCDQTIDQRRRLVLALLPFLSSNIAYIRGVSQMWLFEAEEQKTLEMLFPDSANLMLVQSMLTFIKTNKESVQMRSKLKPVFVLWDPITAIESGEILTLCSSKGAMFRNSELVPSMVFIDAVRGAVHEALQDNWFYSRDLQTILDDSRERETLVVSEGECISAASRVNSQKKYAPAAMFPALEEPQEKRNMTDLIVVTSLVEKVTNIAGLCRTAEVFGAKKLVIPSNHVLKDPQFSSMSVTADKWIDMQEVPASSIQVFLNRLKAEGYTVVCLEQTHDSVEIQDYKFPNPKTCLVLGNEKSGVPVQYLPLMDVCVEIPQRGVIRSLNVHVSGAIAMWQYNSSLPN